VNFELAIIFHRYADSRLARGASCIRERFFAIFRAHGEKLQLSIPLEMAVVTAQPQPFYLLQEIPKLLLSFHLLQNVSLVIQIESNQSWRR
jgi:hypothetical protein